VFAVRETLSSRLARDATEEQLVDLLVNTSINGRILS